jgi:hypothetical protein
MKMVEWDLLKVNVTQREMVECCWLDLYWDAYSEEGSLKVPLIACDVQKGEPGTAIPKVKSIRF